MVRCACDGVTGAQERLSVAADECLRRVGDCLGVAEPGGAAGCWCSGARWSAC